MGERPRFFDDLAGVAGGAFSALAGMREEVESTVRARVDEAIRKFDLVKREDLEAVQEMAALARSGQEAAERRLAALEAKVAAIAMPAHSAATVAADPAVSGVAADPAVSGIAADPAVSGTEAAPASRPPAQSDAGTPIGPLA